MSLWVCRSHGLTGPTGCCPNAEFMNVVPGKGTGWTLTYTGADGKPVTVTADLGPARPIEYTPAPMPSPTPAEEEQKLTIRASEQTEHYVIALYAPDSHLLWAMKQDGTLFIGEGCGPQEAVEWLSKMWDQYGSAAQVRKQAIRRCLAAVRGTWNLRLSDDGLMFHSVAMAALTALLDGGDDA